ncbi:nucleotidyl transferase AbiEii/AbiGii toxin family protein [Candidatus Parcubacteria bacterium]|nr:nucleotidyl transferase AbiEii/AbiGii toxin family protein [Candidatus Parcubacteria bacterium]
MHKEILTKEQVELFPLLKKVSKKFGLVGGTAIALHIGHRKSIDFDLFSYKPFNNNEIKRNIAKLIKINKVLVNKLGEFTFFSNNVKVTFYNFPYELQYEESLEKQIKIPDLLTLAAMKAFALGQRAKWKDYVDLYFIIKDFFSIKQILQQGKKVFGNEFNAKIFRTQLSYFNDVSHREEVVYKHGFEVSEKEIKKKLTEFSLE